MPWISASTFRARCGEARGPNLTQGVQLAQHRAYKRTPSPGCHGARARACVRARYVILFSASHATGMANASSACCTLAAPVEEAAAHAHLAVLYTPGYGGTAIPPPLCAAARAGFTSQPGPSTAPSAPSVPSSCAACGGPPLAGVCAGCGRVAYCGVDCQRSHRARHARYCRAVVKVRGLLPAAARLWLPTSATLADGIVAAALEGGADSSGSAFNAAVCERVHALLVWCAAAGHTAALQTLCDALYADRGERGVRPVEGASCRSCDAPLDSSGDEVRPFPLAAVLRHALAAAILRSDVAMVACLMEARDRSLRVLHTPTADLDAPLVWLTPDAQLPPALPDTLLALACTTSAATELTPLLLHAGCSPAHSCMWLEPVDAATFIRDGGARAYPAHIAAWHGHAKLAHALQQAARTHPDLVAADGSLPVGVRDEFGRLPAHLFAVASGLRGEAFTRAQWQLMLHGATVPDDAPDGHAEAGACVDGLGRSVAALAAAYGANASVVAYLGGTSPTDVAHAWTYRGKLHPVTQAELPASGLALTLAHVAACFVSEAAPREDVDSTTWLATVCDANVKDGAGIPPLWYAVAAGSHCSVRALVDAGAAMDESITWSVRDEHSHMTHSFHRTALGLAVHMHNDALVSVLLDAGARFDAPGAYGVAFRGSPLFSAAYSGFHGLPALPPPARPKKSGSKGKKSAASDADGRGEAREELEVWYEEPLLCVALRDAAEASADAVAARLESSCAHATGVVGAQLDTRARDSESRALALCNIARLLHARGASWDV
ncbi:MAG: hypothetical protein EOO41_01665, partial [Methanobacteriota archaeon]